MVLLAVHQEHCEDYCAKDPADRKDEGGEKGFLEKGFLEKGFLAEGFIARRRGARGGGCGAHAPEGVLG